MKNEIKKVLYDLLVIPSVSSDKEALYEVREYIEKYFEEINGIFIKKYEYNNKPAIVISNFDGIASDILLSGHFDVVPPSEPHQFDIQEIDGKIFARGAGDMKSWVAIMMVLCKEIFSKKLSNKKISLILTWDEEVWWYDWVKKLVEELGYTTKIVLIPDSGSTEKIVIAEKSTIKLHIKANGKSAHASRPWLGENAIENILKIYDELKKTFQDDIKLYGDESHWWWSVNLTIINAGNVTNVIPNEAKASFDIRLTEDHLDLEKVKEKIEEIVKKYNTQIEWCMLWNMLFANLNDDLVQKYILSAKKVLGYTPELAKEHGASDGRFFSARGISVLLQRPTCANIHTAGEYVVESEIEKIFNIYQHFILWLNEK